ncbi:hypothetical protein [Streptomyces millisiae]|uniref:Resolvase/invertase-type recombinase catalytic domain-containing protein n=1 Tax=Streptomyces millisiae TaxID=3075542 RepID=A0ABU2LLZ8_9ACTN|nr:hypothetical protein [Streptomyces sp. DSM 44918]MDT0318530.1 hypothetical protein [Streptomyces sp. DSM 44918]
MVFIALAAEALDEVRWIERSGIDEEDVQRSALRGDQQGDRVWVDTRGCHPKW